jgi:hypothetical protein
MKAVTFVSLLLAGVPVLAQEVAPKEVSPLRVVDKTGAKCGSYIWGLAVPEIGVGNVIYSTNPMPYGKEAEYTNVATSFDVSTAPALYHRVYLPGTVTSMAKAIEAKNPGYKFTRKFEIVALKEAGASAPRQARTNNKPSAAGMAMSTMWNQYWPKNDFDNIDVLKSIQVKKGEHTLRLSVFMEFDTGEFKTVTELKDGKMVTEKVPYLRDFAVAHGECTLVVK